MFDSAPEPPEPLSLQQSPEFERALRAIGTPPVILEDGTLVLQRRWGPLKAHMVARAQVTPDKLRMLRDAKLKGPVILAPESPLGAPDLALLPLISPGYLATLDLTPSLQDLRKGLHQKWRNRLKYSERQGLRVTRQNMPDKPDHWLLVADAVQQLSRGYRTWPSALTCAYARENPGDAKLFTAHIGQAAVAGLIVLRHGNNATFHVAHARASGRMTSAHCLLVWEAISWLKRKKTTRFELGMVDTEVGAGLARFKLGAGATVRALGGTWLWWPPVTQLLRPVGSLDRKLMHAV